MAKKTQAFNAEIKQLLDIVIHSLYSNKEIFLRELISNASDAIDKLKFESLTKSDLLTGNPDFEIRLEADKDKHTLSIQDNGIGMTASEVEEFIGTIAKSGTKSYAQMQKDLSSRPELIGQFGVGFYSAFMVADKVTLHTQKAGSTEGTIWESTGDGSYTLETATRPEGRGTKITLHLKKLEDSTNEDGSTEKAQDFTDTWTLKHLIKKYSDFISWPIKMKVETKKESETVIEDQTLNSQKALWLKSPSEVTEAEYEEFYQHLTHDWNKPAKHVHYKAEGTTEFTSLLYFPSQKPWNYNFKEYEFGLNLYIKRVFIMDHSKDLLPPYLRFVKGLVDSSDLSLNVSRELLQQDRLVSQIKRNIVSKILGTMKDWLSKDRGGYETFWNEFGLTLKEGVPTDSQNKEKIQDLLLFKSTNSEVWTTLEEYVARMKPEQKDIYYITGEKLELLKTSPYLEKLKAKGYEVLLLVDAVDEWVTQGITEYKTKKLVSITKEGLDLDTDEEKKQKEELRKSQKERFGTLIEKVKTALSADVKDVLISDRLTETPACLVSAEHDMSANMQRILSRMEGAPQMNAGDSKRILEINLDHPIYAQMQTLAEDQIKNWSEILYNQALLAEGSPLPNPAHYTRLISDLMMKSKN